MTSYYDLIGVNYSELRKPDPRIGALIGNALGDARTVLNVGAGAGSYEPVDRQVTALEPSLEMIRQRPPSAAKIVQGRAEALPFESGSFDASMAILTVHHWSGQAKGLQEMRRVTRGPIVILTYDPSFRGLWLADYFPELVTLDEAQMPRIDDYGRWLGVVDVTPVPIPHDCTDGFLCAYWRRPAAYLDPRIRAAISSFWKIGDISNALNLLEQDLRSGAWAERHSALLKLDAYDCGYRLVVSS
ncbi:MAG TPA: methyltransferase domain-containing protein [Allosphingosinicella sp.]|jgi:SAM-dependent methyltransferase|uniref:class I SAM-dependent methyltransferase n=1 Tax=Allosphingosinicella sp. TaxID=2823234 RepID=UPI002F289720